MPKLITVQLIATTVLRGSGKTDDDPKRSVEQWFSPDGVLVLEYDIEMDKTSMAFNMVEHLRVITGKDE